MMNLHTFVQSLEHRLPPSAAMKGDRIGLQLQSGRTEISSVFVTMELTEEIAAEAADKGADCVLAFHPLIFAPMTAITDAERVGRICTTLITSGIALVVAHTNFDAFPKGTSTLLAERLGIRVEKPLVADAQNVGFGMGIVGLLDAPESIESFAAKLHALTSAPLRYTLGRTSMLQRIAIVGGSGASFIGDALAAKVDAFITADIKYHDFHRVRGELTLIDAGHYEMEQFVPLGLAALVKEIAEERGQPLKITRSAIVPNPIAYFPQTEDYRLRQERILS
ncbi:MAG: Nif3-like dinuclear metal center hexameric protein [Candidatus Kapabacteria bacterium]|jgi:dinuclear metal center YbgI/SA1388 family protein|nr:Nif3-like dinuclear metal center hexameric protein [Candidatus Kapabacteria bacterium]